MIQKGKMVIYEINYEIKITPVADKKVINKINYEMKITHLLSVDLDEKFQNNSEKGLLIF